jgi:hydrogenase maturation protease
MKRCNEPKPVWASRQRTNPSAPSFLVIGYGNTLRNDDGVGPRVAEALEALQLPGVSTLSCPLLAPETAEPVARAARVIFVDAAVDGPQEVRFHKLAPAANSQVMAHAASPDTILALARDVYGRAPEAWLLTIPVVSLALGDRLSAAAQVNIEIAIQKLKNFARQELVCGRGVLAPLR